MSKKIISIIGIVVILGVGAILTRTVIAEDGKNNWFKYEWHRDKIEQVAEKKGMTVDELKHEMGKEKLEKKDDYLNMTIEERKQMYQDKLDKMQEMWKKEGLSDEQIAEKMKWIQEQKNIKK